MQMIGKRYLWWDYLFILSLLAIAVDYSFTGQLMGTKNLDDKNLDEVCGPVTEVSRRDEIVEADIESFMSGIADGLGKGINQLNKSPDATDETQELPLELANGEMEVEGKHRSLWRKSGNIGGEEILVFAECLKTEGRNEAVEKARRVVGAICKGMKDDKRIWAMSEEFGGVGVGVYLSRSKIALGTIDLEGPQEIQVQFPEMMAEFVRFKDVHKSGVELSKTLKGLLLEVKVKKEHPRCRHVIWSYMLLYAEYKEKDDGPHLDMIGPLQHFMYDIIETMCYAIIQVLQSKPPSTMQHLFSQSPIYVTYQGFKISIRNHGWYTDECLP